MNFFIKLQPKVAQLLNKFIYSISSETLARVLHEQYPQLNDSIHAIHANLKYERRQLIETRKSKEYGLAYKKKNPLVSVRISTFNRAEVLVNRTIPSILNQKYKNIEIVIVGDGCTDTTKDRIKKLNNPKISFFNMPYRGYYPENSFHKWLVAGIPAANEALQKTKGEWIVPFDDDDEMLPNHIEVLLQKAQRDKLEFVYGKALSVDTMTHKKKSIGIFPPTYGHFSLNTSIFHKNLKFFEYDPLSWTINEPGDWNLMKRLMLSGVYIGFVDEFVTKINFIHPKVKTGKNPEL